MNEITITETQWNELVEQIAVHVADGYGDEGIKKLFSEDEDMQMHEVTTSLSSLNMMKQILFNKHN